MEFPTQVKLGKTLVSYLEKDRFVFRDQHDASQMQVIDDPDVPVLIQFLHQWSDSAKRRIRLDLRSDSPPEPHESAQPDRVNDRGA